MTDKVLSTVLKEVFDSLMKTQRTIMIGNVVAFSAAKNTCDVQPALMTKHFDSTEPVALPLLYDVRALFLGGSGYALGHKAQAGDSCILLVCDRDISSWEQSGGVQVPSSARHHDMSDSVALLGFRPSAMSLSGIRDGISLQSDDGLNAINLNGGVMTFYSAGVPSFTSTAISCIAPDFVTNAGISLQNHTHNPQTGLPQ